MTRQEKIDYVKRYIGGSLHQSERDMVLVVFDELLTAHAVAQEQVWVEVLAEHRYTVHTRGKLNEVLAICTCGFRAEGLSGHFDQHCRHVAFVLAGEK